MFNLVAMPPHVAQLARELFVASVAREGFGEALFDYARDEDESTTRVVESFRDCSLLAAATFYGWSP